MHFTYDIQCKVIWVFFFQAGDGIRGGHVTGVQTCALPIYGARGLPSPRSSPVRGSGGGGSGRRSSSGGVQRASASAAAPGSGTCASDTYSAKRRAERRSGLHASSARSARPAGSGRVVPREKTTGS